MDDDLDYEFICLCCGGRNGADIPECSYHKYVTNHDIDSDEHSHQLAKWITSPDYKGAVLVPVGFQLDDEYRKRILRSTQHAREARNGGLLLFKLPGMKSSIRAVSLGRFLN